MMYKSGYVVCVLVNGQVVSESKNGIIEVPFGSEYVIRLRNKSGKRSVAKIWIDGECVEPNGIIVPYSLNMDHNYVDLDCSSVNKKKYTFVSLDSPDAVDQGKNRYDDDKLGLIEVKFYPEKKITYEFIQYYQPESFFWTTITGPHVKHISSNILSENLPQNQSYRSFHTTNTISPPQIEQGATIEGRKSDTNFSSVYVNVDWTNETSVKIRLVGYKPEPEQANYQYRYCATCGNQKKRVEDMYCSRCGSKFI